jgi:hypothetical protein
MAELVIGDVRPRSQYAADGVQTDFPYDFPILEATDLQVVFDDGDAPGSYSVTGVGLSEGGDVEFDTAPVSGTRVTLYRDMPFSRETDFQESGDFRASVINEELDRMAMLLQQAEMIVEDGLHKHAYDADDSLILPIAADRAGKVLGFDEVGLPITLTDPFESAASGELSATSASASADAAVALNQSVPVDNFAGDGATTTFTLSRTMNNNTSVILSIDGVKQHIAGYAIAGTALTFSAAPPDGAAIEVVMIGFMGLISDVAEIGDDALSGDMVSGGLMDSVSLDSLNGGRLAGFRNIIRNGAFEISQRGASFAIGAAGGVFQLDRWQGYANAAIAGTISQEGSPGKYRLRMQRTAGESTAALLAVSTNIETSDCASLAGKDVTVSFKARRGAGYSAAGNSLRVFMRQGQGVDEALVAMGGFATSGTHQETSFTLTTADVVYSATYILPVGVTQLGLQVWHQTVGIAGVDDWFEITDVQIETGSVATPFERRPHAVELALCQRYFYRPNLKSQRSFCIGQVYASTTAWFQMPFPTTMRAAPTFSISAVSDFMMTDANANGAACTSIALSLATEDSARLTGQRPTTLVAGNTTLLLDNSVGVAALNFDAEL